MLATRGVRTCRFLPPWFRTDDGRRRYLRTFRRSYHPAALEPSPLIGMVLSMFGPT
ncbi:MAG: hypothetical protein R2713_04310 [Ilumatobacteraceae bacterium]